MGTVSASYQLNRTEYFCPKLFFFGGWGGAHDMWAFSSPTRFELLSSVLEALSLNHRTERKVPAQCFLIAGLPKRSNRKQTLAGGWLLRGVKEATFSFIILFWSQSLGWQYCLYYFPLTWCTQWEHLPNTNELVTGETRTGYQEPRQNN